MGLLDAFLRERHMPCYGNRTVWGARTPEVTDFMRDPDGHGWHLDRARFDRWLRFAAVARGARMLAPATPSLIGRADGRWQVQLTTDRGIVDLSAAFAIDAGGRAAPLARRLGAKPAMRPTDWYAAGYKAGRARPWRSSVSFSESRTHP